MMPGTCICRMSPWDEVERKRNGPGIGVFEEGAQGGREHVVERQVQMLRLAVGADAPREDA